MSDSSAPDSDNELPSTPVDPGEFVAAGTAQDAFEAQILVRVCEEAGIPALVDSARGGMVEKLSNPSEAWTIRVPVSRLEEARKLIDSTSDALESDSAGGEQAAEEAEEAEEKNGESKN